jgi:HAD superfamily hydrolase (TIGR01509 family)
MAADFDLVIFDCDGVLVDSEVLSCRCVVDVLKSYGIAIDLEDVFERFLGRSSAVLDNYVAEQTGSPVPLDFRQRLNNRLTEIFEHSLQVMPDVPDVLTTMDQPFCLATSSDPERIGMTMRVSGLDRFFRGRIFTASMVEHGKPAPDLFLHAAKQMGTPPQRTLVVEDSVNGVLAGKSAGMTVWGFFGGSHYVDRDGERLLGEAGADRTFRSLNDLMAMR